MRTTARLMRSGERRARRPRRRGGFTYVVVLVWVALIGIGLAITGDVWRTTAQREREDELLFIGGEFRRALNAYYEGSSGAKRFPPTLEALLRDERYSTVRRYLRKMYVDPMTGQAQWGVVRRPDGAIVGVYSLSGARPLRTANFSASEEEFAGKRSYTEWVFRADTPGMVMATPPTDAAAPPAAAIRAPK